MKNSCRLVAACALVAGVAAAQFPAAGGGTNPLAGMGQPAPKQALPPAQELPPLVYAKPLPEDPIGTINGQPIPVSALLEMLVKQNLSQVQKTLVSANILELELAANNLTITEEQINAEAKALIEKITPGRSLEQVVQQGAYSLTEIKRQAWMSAGWTQLMWKVRDIPEDKRAQMANPMMIQLFVQQTMQGYDVKMRGSVPGPMPGLVAEVTRKANGATAQVTADQALDFVLGLVKPGSLTEALNDIVDMRLVQNALTAAKKTVAPLEVETWARSQSEMYTPPFDWATVCRARGTTVEAEKERFRRVEAWKRVTGANPNQAALDAFRDANIDYFTFKTVEVSHILLKTRDDVTGLDKDAAIVADAGARAKDLCEKAREGLDFGWLVENYSDDEKTTQAKGRIAGQIKARGGSIDPVFQKTAFALKPDEISDPVKCIDGWHVIRCEKINEGRKPDWTTDAQIKIIRDEYDTDQMKAWIAKMRAESKVTVDPVEKLWRLKDLSFAQPKEAPTSKPADAKK